MTEHDDTPPADPSPATELLIQQPLADTPPVPRRSRRRLWLVLAAVIGAIVLIAVGYSVVRLLLDDNAYHAGHEAYQHADCAAAIGRYDSVINGWRLVSLGNTVPRAESEKAECLPFRDAVDRQQAGDRSRALIAYVRFLSGRPDSPLTAAARDRITALLSQSDLTGLATVDSCDQLPQLRERKLIPSAAAPGFHAACGTAYEHVGGWDKAARTYALLFTDFGTGKVAAETEAAMIGNTSWCLVLDKIRNDAVLAARGDLLPGLLLTCAKASTPSPAAAIEDAEEFLRKFPGHRLTGELTGTYARLIYQQVRADPYEPKDFGPADLIGTVGGDKAVVMVYNDGPEVLRVVFTGGPEPRVEEVEACPSCQVHVNASGRPACPDKAPLKRIVITPGEYDFATDRPNNSTTTGGYAHWSLKPGKQYFSCIGIYRTG